MNRKEKYPAEWDFLSVRGSTQILVRWLKDPTKN